MIQLLKAYEGICIEKEDFVGADSVKQKIEQLKTQQIIQNKEDKAVREKAKVSEIIGRWRQYATMQNNKFKSSNSNGIVRYGNY